MVNSSRPQIQIMTGNRQSTVPRRMVGVGGGTATAAWPILMVNTTTHPGP